MIDINHMQAFFDDFLGACRWRSWVCFQIRMGYGGAVFRKVGHPSKVPSFVCAFTQIFPCGKSFGYLGGASAI
jgi:hypothetical protein